MVDSYLCQCFVCKQSLQEGGEDKEEEGEIGGGGEEERVWISMDRISAVFPLFLFFSPSREQMLLRSLKRVLFSLLLSLSPLSLLLSLLLSLSFSLSLSGGNPMFWLSAPTCFFGGYAATAAAAVAAALAESVSAVSHFTLDRFNAFKKTKRLWEEEKKERFALIVSNFVTFFRRKLFGNADSTLFSDIPDALSHSLTLSFSSSAAFFVLSSFVHSLRWLLWLRLSVDLHLFLLLHFELLQGEPSQVKPLV
jgi:hypothetical protein